MNQQETMAVSGLAPDLNRTGAGGRADTLSDPLSDGLADPLSSGAAVQADTGGIQSPDAQQLADWGTQGSGGQLPHFDKIQASFGSHDVSGVSAHTGPAAQGAADAMGANAFARGNDVALGRTDLRTTAHEAAHAVQQQGGVQLQGGVGKAGDRYEQNADAVADAVVAGQSAESLLSPFVGGASGGGGAVQMDAAEGVGALHMPDTLKADTKVYKQEWGSATFEGPPGRVAFGRLIEKTRGKRKLQRKAVNWHAWKDGAYAKMEGFVELDAVLKGSDEQTAVLGARILPKSAAGIDQKDCYQSAISDCYWQAAMISVANSQPNTIMRAINVGENSVDVRLFDQDGKPETVTVAKSLFIDKDGNPYYGGQKDGYLWPAFLQKAWAVKKGSYSRTQMGLAGKAMLALTGSGKSEELGGGGDSSTKRALSVYNRLTGAINGEKPVALSTGSFAKKGLLKQWLNSRKGDDPSDLPQGKVRNLHAYAVLDMDKTGLEPKDFAKSIPKVTLTLRDPRDKEGGTFTRSLKDVVTAKKFTQVHWG